MHRPLRFRKMHEVVGAAIRQEGVIRDVHG